MKNQAKFEPVFFDRMTMMYQNTKKGLIFPRGGSPLTR